MWRRTKIETESEILMQIKIWREMDMDDSELAIEMELDIRVKTKIEMQTEIDMEMEIGMEMDARIEMEMERAESSST